MTAILRSQLLSQFSCLGDKCVDTCCRGWSMQVDEATLSRYREKASELLDAVEPGGPDAPWIMRKDVNTSLCVKLEGGLCGIHKQYGDTFLGDACHFYPRVTRSLGDRTLMTAAASCPEIVRLMLEMDEPFAPAPAEIERLPHVLKNYLPDGLTSDEALAVHGAFLDATKDAAPVETIFARIVSASRSLELVDKKTWPQAAPFYLTHADARLPVAETNPADPFNLLHALVGLIVATHKVMSERLQKTVSEMEASLAAKLDWQNVLIHTDEKSFQASQDLHALWEREGAVYQKLLKRWLAMQLSLALYPFSGLGANLSERTTIIGVRLATLKLALASAHAAAGKTLPQEEMIRVVQSLSRFLDHLGDAAFSMRIYNETGWTKETRLRGLLS